MTKWTFEKTTALLMLASTAAACGAVENPKDGVVMDRRTLDVLYDGYATDPGAVVDIYALDPASKNGVKVDIAFAAIPTEDAIGDVFYRWGNWIDLFPQKPTYDSKEKEGVFLAEKYWSVTPDDYWTDERREVFPKHACLDRPCAMATTWAQSGSAKLSTFQDAPKIEQCIDLGLNNGYREIQKECSEGSSVTLFAKCGTVNEQACPGGTGARELGKDGCIKGTAAVGPAYDRLPTCVSCGHDGEKSCNDICLEGQGALDVDGRCSKVAGQTGKICKAGSQPCDFWRATCESKVCEPTFGGPDEPCYGSDNLCIEGLNCVDGICQATGAKDQACNPDTDPDDTCDPGLVCQDGTCQSGGPDQPCNVEEPACDDDWYSCGEDGFCRACGQYQLPACPAPAEPCGELEVRPGEWEQLKECNGYCWRGC